MEQQYCYLNPPAFELRKDSYRKLRKHSVAVGLCLLANFIAQELFFIFMMLFGLDDVYESNPAFQYAVGSLVTIFAMGLPFYLYSCRKGRLSYKKVLPFYTPQPFKKVLCIVIAAWGICILFNFIAALFSSLLSSVGVEEYVPDNVVSGSWLDVLMNFVVAAVVAPLVEEFVFRGVIMQPLRRYGDTFAVITTSLIFAFAHGRPTNILFAFGAGLAIGFAVVYTQSIWVGIIIHMLNNGFSVFFTEMFDIAGDTADLFYLISCCVIALAGIVFFIVYGKKYGFKTAKDTFGLKRGKKIFGFFVTVPMVFAVSYLLYIMFINIQ